ncbi:MAG: chemotaxis protein CheY [Candidatus Micrarchaeota archaeon]|nr:MAG: chemotaxis protein CheY [Candidatus Micrarchaeota archaeon]
MDEIDIIRSFINQRSEATYDELLQFSRERSIDDKKLDEIIDKLKKEGNIVERFNGNLRTFYIINNESNIKKVVIVDDDVNINKLIKASLGSSFEIYQVYDGVEAMKTISMVVPDLVILDLMLPGKDGLQICYEIKTDPRLKNTIVIIISALDPTSNRFKGLKYGADYYLKKPFDPSELKNLVTIFLKKKGKRFDPLIDLPDEQKISEEFEKAISSGADYSIGIIKIDGLKDFVIRYGASYGVTIIRLISQMLQDIIKPYHDNIFIGFLNSESFIITGKRDAINEVISKLDKEFNAVMQFIMQDIGYKQFDINIDSIFESEQIKKLSIKYIEMQKDSLKLKRDDIIKKHNKDPGSYTYEELLEIFGNDNFDIEITRKNNDIEIKVKKINKKDSNDEEEL